MSDTSSSMPMSVRIRLSAMMFLQYLMFAVFWVPLSAYLTAQKTSDTVTWLTLSTMAFGCVVAPIFCMIADRHFASNRVLMILNVACGVLFFVAARQTEGKGLFVYLLLAMFCYMPTWSLTNAVAMANSPSEKFPQIRVFGSIGWVASGLFSLVALKLFAAEAFDGTALPLYCGAGTAIVAAITNLTLPNTPPPAKGREASIVDALGLRALTLMKNFNFAAFILLSMLVMIPFTLYFNLGSQFFQSQGFKYVTVTMNWGQLVEIFLMLLVPLALSRFGIKWTIMVGLGALVVRYVAFWGGVAAGQTILYFVAILVHGVIFGFFFVGGQVYVDKKAPPEIRAQAQGLIVLICFGVGMFLGNLFNVKLTGWCTTDGVCDWNPVFMITSIISAI
ncbi:MAG: MFS transporter, partial [Sedimentisphaerales bacterium]|nr:MFS transporter [Sedimentisphaerales bacterium]